MLVKLLEVKVCAPSLLIIDTDFERFLEPLQFHTVTQKVFNIFNIVLLNNQVWSIARYLHYLRRIESPLSMAYFLQPLECPCLIPLGAFAKFRVITASFHLPWQFPTLEISFVYFWGGKAVSGAPFGKNWLSSCSSILAFGFQHRIWSAISTQTQNEIQSTTVIRLP